MGIDYSASLGIGFVVSNDDLLKPFTVETEEKFHMEDRFDPKTGKKLAPVKVIDEEGGETYEFEGERYEDTYELFDAMGKKLGCEIANQGGYSNGETLYVFVDGVEHTGEDDCDDGRFSVGTSVLFDEVARQKSALDKLAKAFKKYGIDLGPAKVFVAWDIS